MTAPIYTLIALLASIAVILSIKGNETAKEAPVLTVIVAMVYGLIWPLGFLYSLLFNLNRFLNPKQ